MPKSVSLPQEIKRKEAGGSGGMEDAEAPAKKKKSNRSLDVTGSSSSSPLATSAASGGALCSFPMRLVWRLVRGECGGAAAEIRTTADAVFIINKASELFLERLTEDAHAFSRMERKNPISYNHISSTVNRGKIYEFLSDFAPEKIRAEDALKSRPTFYRIIQNKSTEGFKSEPYIIALFSALLWLYYAFIKTNALLLIIINSVGCIIELIYISIFLIYAARKARIYAAKIVLILIGGVFSTIILVTLVFLRGSSRLKILGWICVVFAVSVFAAPLSIMKRVVQTKSVEFMPFNLSLFLTLSGIAWFLYGLLSNDIYVMLPNVLGVSFGFAQLILYMMYKGREVILKDEKVDDVGEETKVNMSLEELTTDKKEENCVGERMEQMV